VFRGNLASHGPNLGAHNAANTGAIHNTERHGRNELHGNTSARADSVRRTLHSNSVAGALRNRGALHNPRNRAQIAAAAARAGWRNGGRGDREGWLRHRHGGYGWVGPLFWPFAYWDLYDYALWGDGFDPSFWDYGYDDLYAGLFSPYNYDELSGYLPQTASLGGSAEGGNSQGVGSELSQMCGNNSGDIAGVPVDRVQQALQLNDAQHAALDALSAASAKAAQTIQAACPSDVALTAPSRLAAMQQRIEAMIAAVRLVQPPLDKFYGLLNDEQKARLTALSDEQHASSSTASIAQSCSQAEAALPDWPGAEIEQAVHPTQAQQANLDALHNAVTKAADLLKSSCPTDNPLTPPARLAAAEKRLEAMVQAVKTVRQALGTFYGSLQDEQKAQFDAIGRTGRS
jgi:hypothetical protein